MNSSREAEPKYSRRTVLKGLGGLTLGIAANAVLQIGQEASAGNGAEKAVSYISPISTSTEPDLFAILPETNYILEKVDNNPQLSGLIGKKRSNAWRGQDGSWYMLFDNYLAKVDANAVGNCNFLDEVHRAGLDSKLIDDSGKIIPPKEDFNDHAGTFQEVLKVRRERFKVPEKVARYEEYLRSLGLELGAPTGSDGQLIRYQSGVLEIKTDNSVGLVGIADSLINSGFVPEDKNRKNRYETTYFFKGILSEHLQEAKKLEAEVKKLQETANFPVNTVEIVEPDAEELRIKNGTYGEVFAQYHGSFAGGMTYFMDGTKIVLGYNLGKEAGKIFMREGSHAIDPMLNGNLGRLIAPDKLDNLKQMRSSLNAPSEEIFAKDIWYSIEVRDVLDSEFALLGNTAWNDFLGVLDLPLENNNRYAVVSGDLRKIADKRKDLPFYRLILKYLDKKSIQEPGIIIDIFSGQDDLGKFLSEAYWNGEPVLDVFPAAKAKKYKDFIEKTRDDAETKTWGVLGPWRLEYPSVTKDVFLQFDNAYKSVYETISQRDINRTTAELFPVKNPAEEALSLFKDSDITTQPLILGYTDEIKFDYESGEDYAKQIPSYRKQLLADISANEPRLEGRQILNTVAIIEILLANGSHIDEIRNKFLNVTY